jgi:probable rRNA maturation factor
MKQVTIAFLVDENYNDLVSKETLLTTVEATFVEGRVLDSPSITVLISDDERLKVMNLRYRGIDKATDVLAFDAGFYDPDLETRYLGDVVISYQQAQKQADTLGHTVEEELQLLVVHGVLHLLGFDHDTDVRKEEMWSIQTQVLAELGIEINIEDV